MDPITFAIVAGTVILLCWWAIDTARKIRRENKEWEQIEESFEEPFNWPQRRS